MRYFLRISYFGPAFHGWQIQPNAPSVQQTLNEKLSLLFRQEVYVVGAGRTDTGVHARGMVCHFDLAEPLTEPNDWVHRINSFTDEHLAAQALWAVPDDAHARFSAQRRRYAYRICLNKDPFEYQRAWMYNGSPKPDPEAMNKAANMLLGSHDFASFAKANNQHHTTMCEVFEARWEQADGLLVFHVEANRFLRNMVRALVGTLVQVGTGRISAEEFGVIMNSRNRSGAGESAPAEGLYFINATYPQALTSNV